MEVFACNRLQTGQKSRSSVCIFAEIRERERETTAICCWVTRRCILLLQKWQDCVGLEFRCNWLRTRKHSIWSIECVFVLYYSESLISEMCPHNSGMDINTSKCFLQSRQGLLQGRLNIVWRTQFSTKEGVREKLKNGNLINWVRHLEECGEFAHMHTKATDILEREFCFSFPFLRYTFFRVPLSSGVLLSDERTNQDVTSP